MRTLEQCIDLFNQSESHTKYFAVKQMEAIGEWETAAKYWRMIHHIADAEACELIANSTAMGNLYREKVSNLNKFVDDAVENEILSKEEAVNVVYPQVRGAYNSVFNNN